jgi:hypothetical protein
MTTTLTTKLPRSSPHRIRRNVCAALAAGALIASTALVANRIVDDASSPGAVQSPNASSVGVTAADVCSGGLGWACISTNAASLRVTETDVCSGGLGWACISTNAPSLGVTATDVCSGGLGWACISTPQS